MSCCISSAVCCVLIIAAMAGIALGYNYSLAEYIDLKETNVSIYLKRGVFDDDISDTESRRAGHLPLRGHLEDDNLLTAESESTTVRSGRRLDNSVFESSGDQNKFEGSLMRLTAKPLYAKTTSPWMSAETILNEIAQGFSKDSIDSLKSIQNVLDYRRQKQLKAGIYLPEPSLPVRNALGDYQDLDSRRKMQDHNAKPMNPARLAVPDQAIGDPMNWAAVKYPQLFSDKIKNAQLEDMPLTYPSPIAIRTDPLRPTASSPTQGEALFLTRTQPFIIFSKGLQETVRTSTSAPDMNVQSIKDKLLMANEMEPGVRYRPKTEDDYDYKEIKGLPVRKRRSIKIKEISNNDGLATNNYTNPYTSNLDNRLVNKSDSELKYNKHNIVNEVISSKEAMNMSQSVLTGVHESKQNKLVDVALTESSLLSTENNNNMSDRENGGKTINRNTLVSKLKSNLEKYKMYFLHPSKMIY